MDNKKRLSEWTLAECKEYCIERCKNTSPCDGCILSDSICAGDACKHWVINTLTDGEKAIMRVCGAKWVTRSGNKNVASVRIWGKKPTESDGDYINGGFIADVLEELFPSVSCGDCIELED